MATLVETTTSEAQLAEANMVIGALETKLQTLENKLAQNLKIEKLDNSQQSESFFDKAPIKRMNTTQNKKKSA